MASPSQTDDTETVPNDPSGHEITRSWSRASFGLSSTTVDTVSTVVLERPKDARDHDLVISWPDGSFGTVSVSSVCEGLAMEYGYEATHDRLTALPNRVLLLDRLSVL